LSVGGTQLPGRTLVHVPAGGISFKRANKSAIKQGTSMSITMYDAAIPPLRRALANLLHILDKGAAHAENRKIDPVVLVNMRLFPDMFPLARQVQIATDVAKGCAARLAALEPPKYEDNEQSFPELKARVDKTLAYLGSVDPARIDGSEGRTISLKVGGETLTYQGLSYLQHFVLPNVYFHVTTTYAILRHCGVEVGKRDFLGSP